MKVFVTGATGFIGKNLVDKLIELNFEVTVNIHSNKFSLFSEKVKTYRLNEMDIQSDISFFKEAKFSGIIHLASLYLTTHKPIFLNVPHNQKLIGLLIRVLFGKTLRTHPTRL
jgi:nucleoside-diphosphate-sugar epimerase